MNPFLFRIMPKKNYTIDKFAHFAQDFTQLQRKSRIMIIDDEDVPYLEQLQKRNYNLYLKDDLHNITDVAEYDIVITDIKGVGRSFNENLEGGAIIKELKKHYPEKYIIVYSASQFDVNFNSTFQLADKVIKKDCDIEAWVEAIDEGIREYYNPQTAWKKTHKTLVDNNISTRKILKLEQAYVYSILKKKDIVSTIFSDDRQLIEIIIPLLKIMAFLMV